MEEFAWKFIDSPIDISETKQSWVCLLVIGCNPHFCRNWLNTLWWCALYSLVNLVYCSIEGVYPECRGFTCILLYCIYLAFVWHCYLGTLCKISVCCRNYQLHDYSNSAFDSNVCSCCDIHLRRTTFKIVFISAFCLEKDSGTEQ